MRKSLKFFVTFFLCSIFTLVLSTTSHASVQTTNDGIWRYSISSNRVILHSYLSSDANAVIPDEIDGYPVTEVAMGCFNTTTLQTITLSQKYYCIIDQEAIKNCPNFIEWKINTSTKSPYSIQDGCLYSRNEFYNCPKGKASVALKDTTTEIGYAAFSGCKNITSIQLPDSVTQCNYRSFSNCVSLVKIEIGNSLYEIPSGCFSGCTSLTNFTVSENNRNFYGENGALYSKDKQTLLSCPALSTIPSTPSIKNIGKNAFSGNRNLSIAIVPESVTCIKGSAFSNCYNLHKILLPANLTTLESMAFSDCSSLTDIQIPNQISTLADGLFYGCSSLSELSLGSSVESLDGDYFDSDVKLQKISISNKNPYLSCIGSCIYNKDNTKLLICFGCSTITLPEGLTTVENAHIYNPNAIRKVSIPSSLCSFPFCDFTSTLSPTEFEIAADNPSYCIENNMILSKKKDVFYGCFGIKQLIIPDTVTSIDADSLSYNTEVISVAIPNSITSLPDLLFNNIPSLKDITIPDSVIDIGEDCFYSKHAINVQCNPDSYIASQLSQELPTSTRIDIHQHDFQWHTTTAPTVSTMGHRVKKCSICGLILEEEAIPLLTSSTPTTNTNKNSIRFSPAIKLTVHSTTSSLSLKWSRINNAVGYELYQYKKNGWTKIKSIRNRNTTSYLQKKLKSATKFSFRIRAYTTINGKKYYSNFFTTTTATKPGKVYIKTKKLKSKKLRLTFKKVARARGYQVQIAKDKRMRKARKTYTTKKSSFSHSWKKSKTCYIKIRSYILVGSKKIYSSWSKVTKVR